MTEKPEDKSNEAAKDSPGAMKAEFTYREYTGVMAAAAQIYREFGIAKTLTHPESDGKPTIVYMKNIIDHHTNLSAKEEALREMVEAVEDDGDNLGIRLAGAVAEAKKVLKP